MKTSHKHLFLFCTMWLMAVMAGSWIGSQSALGQTGSCGECAFCVEFEQVWGNGIFIGYTVKGTNNQFAPRAFGGTACGSSAKGYLYAGCFDGGCPVGSGYQISYCFFSNANTCSNANEFGISEADNGVSPTFQGNLTQMTCSGPLGG